MALNEPQRVELAKILDSDLFQRAEHEVLLVMDGPIYNLAAPEQGMQLAVEKGVRTAFRQLRKLTLPPRENPAPTLSTQISHKRTNPQP